MLCRYMKFLETKQHYKYIYIKNSKETPRLIGKILLQKKKKKKEREREREKRPETWNNSMMISTNRGSKS